jgi:hypothetical protein
LKSFNVGPISDKYAGGQGWLPEEDEARQPSVSGQAFLCAMSLTRLSGAEVTRGRQPAAIILLRDRRTQNEQDTSIAWLACLVDVEAAVARAR